LLAGGEKGTQDCGARVVRRDDKFYVRILDFAKVRRGVGDLLGLLQVIKSRGDGAAATQIFDRFGTRVNPEWRKNIRERAARLKLPNKSAFVFPRLEPVMEGSEIKDVRLYADEDLTMQQLRMSRLRFNKKIPE
jgi:dipeptidyl-peptidase-3